MNSNGDEETLMVLDAHFRTTPLLSGELREGWFAVSHHWVLEKEQRRRLYGRWFRLDSDHVGHRPVFRVIRFSPNLPYDSSQHVGGIAIDWEAWIDLQGRDGIELDILHLMIRPARPWEAAYAVLWHPNPSERWAARLGALALVLSLLSFVH